MKKLVIVLALLLATLMLFAACEGNKPEEQHVHTFSDWIAEIPATCTEDGTKGHFHCSECGKDFDDDLNELSDIVIPKPGHSFGNLVEGKPVTCTEDGLTAYYHCSVCNKNFDMDGNEVTDPVIHAEGHKLETIANADPTCDTKGAIAHQRCTVCDARFDMDGNPVEKETVEIPELGHKFGEWIPESDTSCDKEGTKGHYHCEVCGRDYEEDEKTVIEDLVIPVGHVLVMKGDINTGKHYECSRCGQLFDVYGNEITATNIDLIVAIETAQELFDFASAVNAGHDYQGKTVVLMNDIDLADVQVKKKDKNGNETNELEPKLWQQIGLPSTTSGGGPAFRGKFNGQGHTISNMKSVLRAETGDVDMQGGLFGYLGDGAIVENFTLTGSISITKVSSSASGTDYFGSIANAVEGNVVIQNVYSSVNFDTHGEKIVEYSFENGVFKTNDVWDNTIVRNVGGLVGMLIHNSSTKLTIDGCMYDGTIKAGNGLSNFAGILAHTGKNESGKKVVTIQNTIFTGKIELGDQWNWSGIASFISYAMQGYNLTINIQDCISTGTISGMADTDNADTCGQIIATMQGDTKLNLSNVYYTPTTISLKNTRTAAKHSAFEEKMKELDAKGNLVSWYSSYDEGTEYYTDEYTILLSTIAKKGLDYYVDDDRAVETTLSGLILLSDHAFTDASKWKWNAEDEYNIPCPKSLVEMLEKHPEPLVFNKYVAIYDNVDENHPAVVNTVEDLLDLATAVNKGATFEGKTVKLAADLDMTDTAFNGIGETSSKPFMGSFDGQGYTITLKQTLVNPDGNGGLFNFVRVPENGTVTIENLHIAGQIDATNTSNGYGYFGGLISAVDAGTSGNGGTINITNVWNSVYINCGNANMWTGVGGYIGFVRHANGLKPLTINFDSCLWDGTLNAGPAAYHFGGYVGYTGNNKEGRTLTINIFNSVAAGKIALNINWDQYAGLLVGYAKGTNSDADTAKVTINVNNVISDGSMTFGNATCPGSGSKIGHIARIDGTTEVNMTNLYYNAFKRGALEGNAPALDGEANTAINVVAMTDKELTLLNNSAFTNASDWYLNGEGEYNIPCPKSLIEALGEYPDSLKSYNHKYTALYDEFDENHPALISTEEDLLGFASAVNKGATFEGITVKLTADLNMTGLGFNGIGVTSSRPFMGNFDGQGHTIILDQTLMNPDGEGGLFSFIRVPENGTVNIENVHIDGTMAISNDTKDRGFLGALISCVDAGKSGDGGILNVTNCWSSVTINAGGSGSWYAVGGMIGFLRHEGGLKELTVNMDSCLWDGVLNFSSKIDSGAGLVAYTGNQAKTTKNYINVTNTVVAGQINLNTNDSDDTGLVFGYLRGNGSNPKDAQVIASVSNVICTGTITSSVDIGSGNWIGMWNTSEKNGYPAHVNITNFYYISFEVPGKGPIVIDGGTGTGTTGLATEITPAQMSALGTTDFSDSSKWTKEDGYFICPAGIFETFGAVPDSLHAHTLTKLDPVKETLAEYGKPERYECADENCPDKGKFFNADGYEINQYLPHDHMLFLQWVDEVPADSENNTNGKKGHFYCTKCYNNDSVFYYFDENQKAVTEKDLILYPFVTKIKTAADLKRLSYTVNELGLDYTGKTVTLEADIDISGAEVEEEWDWVAIGTSDHPFTGSFDGQGHTIRGLTQTRDSAIDGVFVVNDDGDVVVDGRVGLFGFVQAGSSGTITIENFNLTGTITGKAGGADAGTVISQVVANTKKLSTINISGIWSEVKFEVSGDAMSGAGGILGSVATRNGYKTTINIDGCRYSGKLKSNNGSSNYGGIVGWSQKNLGYFKIINITNCLVDGNIILSGDSDTLMDCGGIIGFFNGAETSGTNIAGKVENCIFAGTIQTSSGISTGYIIGEVSSTNKIKNAAGKNGTVTVTNCYYVEESSTGMAQHAWLGLSTQDQKVTATNVESKTLDEIKATDLYKSFIGE